MVEESSGRKNRRTPSATIGTDWVRVRGLALVFKAHRPLYHSTLGWSVIKKKKKFRAPRFGFRGPGFGRTEAPPPPRSGPTASGYGV